MHQSTATATFGICFRHRCRCRWNVFSGTVDIDNNIVPTASCPDLDSAIRFTVLNCIRTSFAYGQTQIIPRIRRETFFLCQYAHSASHGTYMLTAT
jgi:hypothetical protein